MHGDDRVRFCSRCQLNVYNFSEMSADEIQALVKNREGRLCARIYQRSDGRTMTADCPIPFAKARRRMAYYLAAALMVLFSGFGAAQSIALGGDPNEPPGQKLRKMEPFKTVFDWFDPPQYVAAGHVAHHPSHTVGVLCVPPTIPPIP